MSPSHATKAGRRWRYYVSQAVLQGRKQDAAIFAAALALALAPLATPSSAEAKGCLKGALVGGVAGHYAGHHGVLGAIGGCVVGHHMANEKNKENQAISPQAKHSANQTNGD